MTRRTCWLVAACVFAAATAGATPKPPTKSNKGKKKVDVGDLFTVQFKRTGPTQPLLQLDVSAAVKSPPKRGKKKGEKTRTKKESAPAPKPSRVKSPTVRENGDKIVFRMPARLLEPVDYQTGRLIRPGDCYEIIEWVKPKLGSAKLAKVPCLPYRTEADDQAAPGKLYALVATTWVQEVLHKQFLDGLKAESPIFISDFGYRSDPESDSRTFHGGVDNSIEGSRIIFMPFGGKVVHVYRLPKGVSKTHQRGLLEDWEKKLLPAQRAKRLAQYRNYLCGNRVTVQFNLVFGQSPPFPANHTFCHLESILVNDGDTVSGGMPLAVAGNTGRTYGPTGIHLHEIIQAVQAADIKYVSDQCRCRFKRCKPGLIHPRCYYGGAVRRMGPLSREEEQRILRASDRAPPTPKIAGR